MSNPTHDPAKLHEYRERAAALHDLSKGVEERIGKAAESGTIEAAREALGELRLQTKAFEDFRKTLTPAEIFLAKYNVEVVNDHTVSFVVPRGVAPIEILQEAQGLVTDRDLIYPDQLAIWAEDPKFTTEATNSERICIDGHVPNSINKDRTAQEEMVGKENLPSLEHLAVAFAVNWIATREPLFGWYNKNEWCHVVRAAGGALDFHSNGLRVDVIHDDISSADVAVSSRALRLRQGYVGQAGIKKLDSWPACAIAQSRQSSWFLIGIFAVTEILGLPQRTQRTQRRGAASNGSSLSVLCVLCGEISCARG